MKLNCGPTAKERHQIRLDKWLSRRRKQLEYHKWFAWYPVRVGPRDCRWLEVVLCRRNNVWFHNWTYKPYE